MVKSSLSKTHPDISRDWILDKNFPLIPEQIDAYSKQLVWWRCERGHEYRVSVYSRVRSRGCKVCNKPEHIERSRRSKLGKGTSLSAGNAKVSLEWDFIKNSGLTPEDVAEKSHILVWWKCSAGHSWQSTPNRRSRGDGCPECSKLHHGERVRAWRLKKSGISFAEAYPNLITEWDYEHNSIQPDKVSPKSGLKVSWVCKYGHKWLASISNRTIAGSNCPLCNPQSSRIEIFLLCELRSVFDRVVWRKRFGGNECDIFIPELRLGIEVGGEYWHRGKGHREQQKFHAFSKLGIHLIRVRDSKLPPTVGDVVWYDNGEPPIQTTVRLFKEINLSHPNQKLRDYVAAGNQQNQTEYQQTLARLPAPPTDQTLLSLFPLVAEEWDYKKNYPTTPDLFSPYSDQNVSWVCPFDHHWKATIKNRTLRQSGCPTCYRATHSANSREYHLKKLGSLKKANPAYLNEWDQDRNGELKPAQVTVGSNIKVWWKCPEGHSYQQALAQKNYGAGCPECFSLNRSSIFRKVIIIKKGSLLDKYPHIAQQWDDGKNGEEKPSEFTPGSHKAVWWVCDIGHSYRAPIRDRCRKGLRCPLCRPKPSRPIPSRHARLFSEARPDLLHFWDDKKNLDISPESVHASSRQKVWWHCDKGHSYMQAIADKVTGSGCPECARKKRAETVRLRKLERTGSLQDKFPELVIEWHPTKNGILQPQALSSGSHQTVWWRCLFGHEWQESPNRRTDKRRKYGCLICHKMRKG
jgi:hypothetical protein